MLSVLVPVRRYACGACGWTGLRRRPVAAEVPAVAPPARFIVVMAVVAVGLVLMLGLLLLDVIPGLGKTLLHSLGGG